MSSKYLLFSILIAFLGFLSSTTKGRYINNSIYDVSQFCGQKFRNVNAAFRGPNNYDYIFVNDMFVIFGKSGKIKSIRTVFKGIKKVDAAVYSRKQKKIYLIEDNKVWEFSEKFEKIKETPSTFRMGRRNAKVSLLSLQLADLEFILLIKNLKYWFFFPISFRIMNPKKGFKIKNIFNKIPYPLDAALSDDNNFAYFLSGETCTKQQLNADKSVKVEINGTRFLRCFKYA